MFYKLFMSLTYLKRKVGTFSLVTTVVKILKFQKSDIAILVAHVQTFLPQLHCLASFENKNKRSKDLGALLDTCSWYDKWQFSADLY